MVEREVERTPLARTLLAQWCDLVFRVGGTAPPNVLVAPYRDLKLWDLDSGTGE
jgi:hypothetical protein